MGRKILKTAAAALLGTFLLFPATSGQAFDPADRPEIEKIIREYLLTNPQLMLEVQQALEVQQREEAARRAAEALAKNSDVIFNSPNQGVIGNAKGDVTVVEFFDYNCGFCQRAMNDMNALLADDKKLKFVMKELPILSEGSVEASRISTAVYRLFPEKYAEFHNALLGSPGQKDGNRALRVAQSMKLDVDAINAEAQKNDILGAFREANELANSLGINGTPSYVIGDEVVFGALGQEVLREKIDNVRKCGKTVCI
ncbi:MAG: thioredoxin domain-containing protein [Rhizobiaceae bacterium]|nr:thioredoxin domain-containing protein [Rhizobiaceae bacterium]